MKYRPVIICLNNPDLVEILMDHLVQKGVTKVVGIGVEVTANVDGRGIAKVSVVPPASSDPDWYLAEDTTEVLVVELVKPPV